MPEPHEQTEPYFQIHRNYPDRYRCRRARRLGVPATLLAAWYPVMHDIASNAGTYGEFTTDVRAFEEAVGEPERFGTSAEDCERDAYLASVWRLLADAKVCEIVSGEPEPPDGLAGIPSEFRVRVLGMKTEPRRQAKSDAERQAAKRERDRLKEASRNVTNVTKARDSHVTPVMSRGDIRDIGAVTTLRPSNEPGSLTADIIEIGRQRHALAVEEAFTPAAQRIGSARAQLVEIPWSESSEQLDDNRRDLPTAAHPDRRPQNDSAGAA